jgi:hypothetical protein
MICVEHIVVLGKKLVELILSHWFCLSFHPLEFDILDSHFSDCFFLSPDLFLITVFRPATRSAITHQYLLFISRMSITVINQIWSF